MRYPFLGKMEWGEDENLAFWCTKTTRWVGHKKAQKSQKIVRVTFVHFVAMKRRGGF